MPVIKIVRLSNSMTFVKHHRIKEIKRRKNKINKKSYKIEANEYSLVR